MDISQLKGLNTNLSLTDYLNGGKASPQDQAYNLLAGTLNNGATSMDAAASVGVQITLSAEAQKLMAEGSDSKSGNQSGIQKGAQNFLMGFFDQSGVDFENLSAEAKDLIQGLQEVVEGSTATARDLTTDIAEMKYAGDSKKVFTLTGTNTRLRMAVEYDDAGKPTKLSVTDITGGKVETAEITLGKDDDGTARMAINRTQREYVNGHMTGVAEVDPLDVKLYAS